MNQFDYIDAGFRVFGLHSVTNGVCDCGDIECKALYKHPRTSAWQHTPHWSDEQIEVMEAMGQFATGFGVLVDDHIIIDIDPRNGGSEAYEKLVEQTGIDFKQQSGFVVATGGGGWHIYYKRPAELALLTHVNEFEGIDFKSSGYVVGAGSLHLSGNIYEVEKGHPENIAEAPQVLLDLLKKPDRVRSEYKGGHIDLSSSDIGEMLTHCDPSCTYDEWIKIGMAIHDATGGAGFEAWDNWSSTGDTYPGTDDLQRHWHSFGKSSNPVTIGTLIHYAEQGGWQKSVTFESELPQAEESYKNDSIDLLRPPGFLGKLTDWINQQCRFPRERLAVAAALSALGNIGGLRYQDEVYGVTSNQFVFCVAGSATGKEAIQQAQAEIHRAAGLAPATHGAIKSEQEIVRNLIDHQAALYIIDEMGLVLQKIQNARKRGGAAYLEGVIGMLMSAYSKASSFMPLSGDVRKEIKKQLLTEVKQLEKMADDGKDVQDRIDSTMAMIDSIDNGLERPFLSLIGFTTPVTFASLVDYENSANGFFGRSLIVQEKETNPRAKKRFKQTGMDDSLKMTLMAICNGGAVDLEQRRIEHYGPRQNIPTEADALAALDEIEDYYYELGGDAKESTLEAIPRRGFELVLKVSLAMAIPEGIRTLEHVQWAHAFVENDIKEKINLAASNLAESENRQDEAIYRKLLNLLDIENGETLGVIANRCRKVKREDIEKALDNLIEKGYVKKMDVHDGGKRGRPPAARYYLTGK